jgi:hypothetical protein
MDAQFRPCLRVNTELQGFNAACRRKMLRQGMRMISCATADHNEQAQNNDVKAPKTYPYMMITHNVYCFPPTLFGACPPPTRGNAEVAPKKTSEINNIMGDNIEGRIFVDEARSGFTASRQRSLVLPGIKLQQNTPSTFPEPFR